MNDGDGGEALHEELKSIVTDLDRAKNLDGVYDGEIVADAHERLAEVVYE